jgi:Spy/CpxP family protein refolding chaperone
MKTVLGIGGAVAIMVAAVASALAIPEGLGPRGRGRGRDGGREARLAERLGLSEQQRAAWKSLHEEHEAEMEPLRQEGRELHERLQAEMKSENPDSAAVGTAFLELRKHREKLESSGKAYDTRLSGILDDEQKTRFEALKAAHGRHRHGSRRGRRNAPEPPASSPAPGL